MSANLGELSQEKLYGDYLACQRQAALGTLAGIIAHEYNNLMTPVLIRAQDSLARDDVEAMKKALAVTARQTQLALDFTRQVLQFARGEETQSQSCRLRPLIDAAILNAVRPFEKDGIALTIDVPDELSIQARPGFFLQAILNLILNARTAMKNMRGKMRITARRAADRVEIAVVDQGRGFERETLDEAINPFFAANPSEHPETFAAVGMGLQACRIIAWQHGATIRFEHNDGPGCTVRLDWPAGESA
jgi:signal transduction histidine kinase